MITTRGPGGRAWRPALADARRRLDRRLAGQRAEPAGVLPEPALAQPLDVGRPARVGAGRLVAFGLLPDGPLGQRGALGYLAAAAVARDLYFRGYSRVQGGRSNPPPRRALRPRRPVPPPLLLLAPADPAADPQGPADLPPRPGAVVAVPDLLRPARVLLPEHSPAGLCRPEPLLAKPGQFPQPLGDGPDPFDVHQPVHLSAALAGRAQLLGAGPLARCAGNRSSGASSPSRWGSRWLRPRCWSS